MDVATIINKWNLELPEYKKLGKLAFAFLKSEIKQLEISPIISFRAKDQLSIIKKIRKKQIEDPSYNYDSLTDKLGIRIICNFNSELEKVHEFLYKYFNVIQEDIKKNNVSFNKLDYQSNHYDVKINPEITQFKNQSGLKDLIFEIQVRTINQNAWADVAHTLIYKQESEIENLIKRKIFRLIALYELADDEFNSINEHIKQMPDNHIYSLLKKIEGKFYKLSKCDFDRDYSIANLKVIFSFFTETQIDFIHNNIESFITSNEAKIEHIFKDNKGYFLSSSYLTQPEIFIIWFSLVNFEYYITSNWLNNFDYQELEDIANWWGLNITQTL